MSDTFLKNNNHHRCCRYSAFHRLDTLKMARSRRSSSNGLAFKSMKKRRQKRATKKARAKAKKVIRRGNALAVAAVKRSLKSARKALEKIKKKR
jgi:hypothetical protein